MEIKRIFTGLVICVLGCNAIADTLTVDDDGKADFDNIQAAIDAASDGDEILVMPGTYTGTGNQVIDMLGKALWLHSSGGHEITIIDGENARRGLVCVTSELATTIIEDFQFTHGYAEETGGGMYIEAASPSISNCTFTENVTKWGAGMYCRDSALTVSNCVFTNNDAENNAGGIYTRDSSSIITNCTFSSNTTRWAGGIMCHGGTPLITYCTFESNDVEHWGGGIQVYEGTPTIENCAFTSNTSSFGGGIFCHDTSFASVITSCNFVNNVASNSGGGIYCNADSDPVITDCTFDGNSSDAGGGMLCYFSSPTLDNCDFINNISTGNGGSGMYCSVSDAIITNCQFISNIPTEGSVYNNGVGMRCWGGSPTLTGCTFDSNITNGYGYGGGMYCSSSSNPTLTDCIFKNNVAHGNNGGGGGVYCVSDSNPVFDSCTFENNEATGQFTNFGGGVYCWGGSSLFTNCIFTGNNSDAYGGGVYCVTSTPTITECIFQNNNANNYGGGIALLNCVATVSNTQLLNNVALRGAAMSVLNSTNVNISNCTMNGNSASDLSNGVYVADSIVEFVGINILDEIDSFYASSRLMFYTDDSCNVDGDVSPFDDGSTQFDIEDLETDAVLVIEGELHRQGGLGITNDSGSLMASSIGNIIPLAKATSMPSVFDSVVFPLMPEGLGLQLIEYPALHGSDTEIAIEVIGVKDAQFADPFAGNLDNPPIDIIDFDADGDGIDEIAVLFDGEPGAVAVFRVTKGSTPILIENLSAIVGYNPVSIDAGDLNGDGFDDLLVANSVDRSISVLKTTNEGDGIFTFATSTLFLNGSSRIATCVAVMDWDGNTSLDAVVGVDVYDENDEDGYRVFLDVSSSSPSVGLWFGVPTFELPDETIVYDPPRCVNGGEQSDLWGFVGGTKHGRIHKGTTGKSLQIIAELSGNRAITIEASELDAGNGDGKLDLLVSSDEAETIYLFQGDDTEADGFGDLIPLLVSVPVEDVVALDADGDGDKDIVLTAPTSETPLILLRNDGGNNLPLNSMEGTIWSKQIINFGNPPNKIVSGDLDDKDVDDDWLMGAGNGSGLLDEPIGTLEQTNILTQITCEFDIDGDGNVDVSDLLIIILAILEAWQLTDSPADVNGDGIVDITDLLIVVSNWGPCE